MTALVRLSILKPYCRSVKKLDLLIKYNNTILITLMMLHTKHQSMNYLFFLCFKTNVNYTVAEEFIVQSEGAEDIVKL